MRVVDKRQPLTVDFRNVSGGQPFYYPAEEWYGIKTAEETDEGYNAVDLNDGQFAIIGELEQVIEVKGQFEIIG